MMQASLTSYIIGIIVIAFLSYLNEKFNKKADGSKPKKPEDIEWKDLIPKKTQWVQPQPTVHHIEVQKPKKRPATFIEDAREEGKQALPNTAILSNIKEPETNANEEYAFKDMEDVRKAIIWSEIINRKY